MAIALDASVGGSFTGAGPFTLNLQCSGLQRLLVVVAVGMRNSTSSWNWTSATFNSVGLTQQVVDEKAGNNRNVRTAVWTLVNPAAGASYQIAVTPGLILTAARIMAMSFTGVDQTTPVGNTGSHAAQTDAFSASIPTGVANAWLIGGAGLRGGSRSWTPGTDVTEAFDQGSGSSATDDVAAFAGYRACGVAGSYAFAATASAIDHGVLAAVEVRPAASSAGIVPILFGHYARMIQG